MTLAQLEDSLGSSELEKWQAFYQLEPFGAPRDNYHMAMLCALTANIHRGKHQQPYEYDDFMLTAPEIRRAKENRQAFSFFESKAKDKNGG